MKRWKKPQRPWDFAKWFEQQFGGRPMPTHERRKLDATLVRLVSEYAKARAKADADDELLAQWRAASYARRVQEWKP